MGSPLASPSGKLIRGINKPTVAKEPMLYKLSSHETKIALYPQAVLTTFCRKELLFSE